MSTNSGITTNKADKNKATKFKIIDINNVYKGTSVGPPKTTATTRQHGLQSLGKVPSRRMPPPAHLPSLRSEQGGPEQTISLVPAGGAGWGANGKEEDTGTGKVSTTPPVSSSPLPTSQPASVPLPAQAPIQTKTSAIAAEVAVPSSNAQSWSSVTTGAKNQGKLMIVKSRFQEEFPELAAGPDEKSTHQRKEENKELQYGPGPSLRPQNVASWRDGGGRSILQSGPDEDHSSSQVSGSAGKCDGSSSSDDERTSASPGYPPALSQHPAAAAMQRMIRPGMMPGPGPRLPGPPGAGPMMFGPIMPPFMFSGPRFGPQFHGFPPYFHPDQRFRGPLMAPRLAFDDKGQSLAMMKTASERQAIIKDHALKDFDRLESDNSWASAVDRDVDYSAKLVFSDEDDPSSANQRHDKRLLSPRDRYPRRERDERHEPSETGSNRASDSAAESDRDHGRPSPRDRKRPPPVDRDRESSHDSSSQPSSSQFDRMPIDMHWHARLPFPHPMYPPHMRPPGPGVGFQPRLYGKYDNEPAELAKTLDDLPDRDWHSRSREVEDELKLARSNEESKRSDQTTTSTRSMTKLTPQRLVKKTTEENEVSNQSPVSETSQNGEPKGARSADQTPVRAWGSSNTSDDKENNERGWQKNQVATNSQSNASSMRRSVLDDDYPPKNAERISLASETEIVKDNAVESSDVPDSSRTHAPLNQASDTKSQGSSSAIEKLDGRSQRREPTRDRSKRSSGAGWMDNEKEDDSIERDDSRYHSRSAVGNDMQWRDTRRSDSKPNCPPPISLRYCQNNIPTNCRYTPLKRGVLPTGDSPKTINDLTGSTSSVQPAVKEEHQTTNQFEKIKREGSSKADEVTDALNYSINTQQSKKKVEEEAAVINMANQSDRDLPRQLSWGDVVEEESLRGDGHGISSSEKAVRRLQAPGHGRSRENNGPSKFKQDNSGDRRSSQETARHESKSAASNRQNSETTRNDGKSEASNRQNSETARHDSKSSTSNRHSFDTARNENKSAASNSNRQSSETARNEAKSAANNSNRQSSETSRNESKLATSNRQSFDTSRNDGKAEAGNKQNFDTARNESKSATSNRQSSDAARNESKSATSNRQSSDAARNESKSAAGYSNRQNSETARNESKSTTATGSKPGFETTRNDSKAPVSSRRDDVKQVCDDRPPAKKMKDESSSFYGQNRERSDRNRRGLNKGESHRGVTGRTRYGSGNSSRQGYGKESTTEYAGGSIGTEKRTTLTFERSDLRHDPATSDSRKVHVPRPSEPNKKESTTLKSKEDISQQQSFDDKQTEMHSSVPRMNAWDQPLRLPKSEGVEAISKENTEQPTQSVTDKPAEDTGKLEMQSVPSGENAQLPDRGVHREYRTGRGHRQARHGPAKKQTGGRSLESFGGDSESHQLQRKQQRGYNTQRGDDVSEEFDGTSFRGNRRRRTGPTNSGRRIRDHDNAGYKLSTGEFEREQSSRNKISDSGRQDDITYRPRDNRRRNWRQSGNNSSQSYGRVNSDETRRQPRALTTLISAAPQSPKPQSSTEQNLSDVGNEEWETASESSEVLTHTHHHHHRPQEVPGDDAKKPQALGGSRRVPLLSESSRASGSERTSRRGGQGIRGSGVAMRRHDHPSQKQSTEPSTSRATSSAGDASNKVVKSKPVELKDEAAVRAAKAEKDKKDAMANIDINNYASVVVIDDQPEVSIEDPSFLFESNEGFQEVTSRRVQKSRQKAAALEEAKKTQELQIQAVALAKKAEKDRKRLAVSVNKLPPRLTGRREKKHSRTQQQQQSSQQSVASDHVAAPSSSDILPKIENWDNEMANNIPSSMAGATQPVRAVGTAAPVVISPAMPIGKWERGQCDPITVSSITMATPASASDVDGNRCDDAVKSLAALSLQGSSDTENQLRMSAAVVDIIMSSEDGSMQQRQPVSSSQSVDMRLADMGSFMTDTSSTTVVQSKAIEKTIVKPMPKMDDSRTLIKKPDASRTSRTTYEPIELPSNYAFGKFGKGEESSELKLEFTFDADLAKMSSDKPEVEVKDPPPPITMPPSASLHRGTAVVTANVNDLVLPLQSPAADDLNMKIASVKNVWERENHHSSASLVQYFEQSIINAGTQRVVSGLSVDDQVVQTVQSQQQQYSPSTQQNVVSYADYSGYMDVVSTGAHQMSGVDMGCIDGSTILDHNSAALVYIDGSYASNKDSRNLIGEQTNVCKVRPQQLQASSSPPSLVRVGSSLANATQLMYGQGYQYALTQETANMGLQYGGQAPYGYSMTQQPAQTALLAPVGQNNLFLQPAALQQSDLYRNAFGLSAGTPQSTIMVSSATSTLMSAAIKPPSQHIYLASGSQKTAAAVQYGQLMSQAGGLMYETTGNTGQPGLPTSPVGQPADPMLGVGQQQQQQSSQIIGSHLVQQRTAMQPATNYFSQTPLQQTGFYQAQQAAASGSTLQGSYQQLTAQPFSLSTFGHQTPAVTVAVQPVHSQLKLSAPPFKPVSQQVQQMKTSSPSLSYAPTQHSTAAGYLQQQLYGNLMQQQQQPASQQPQFHQYYTQSHQPQSPATNQQPQFYSLQQQQQQQHTHLSDQFQMPSTAVTAPAASGNSSSVVGASWQRHSAASTSVTGPPSAAASTHSQRQTPVATSYSGLQLQQSTSAAEQSKMPSATSKTTSAGQRTYNSAPLNSGAAQVKGGPAGSDTLRELQAQERRKALQQVQSFLNPQNKPPAKSATSSNKNSGKDTGDEDKKQVET